MMACRFDVLGSEVDLNERSGRRKPERTKPRPEDNNKKPQNKTNNKKKKTAAADDNSLQALAFGSNKNKAKKKLAKGENPEKGGSPAKTNGRLVDDDWKRRDNEFVRSTNEEALQEALMLSKLDFEEKKDFYAQVKKEHHDDPKGGKVKKKKDKPVKMSLDQFNSLRPDQMTGKAEPTVPEKVTVPGEANPEGEKFFDNIKEAARKTLERETRHENYKATAGQYNQEIKVSQYEADLEKRDFEIQALRLEVDCLKTELKSVKSRNKKLCEVICSAEMKSKAELVVELDKMSKVREELTQEVLNLSGQVEQERSKVNQLTMDLKKMGNKKKQNTDGPSKD
ncbi:hypothetical protein Pcinc_003100 [Petrolisthes cinctipes]|uniref:G kinase-anchoring protein 1 n=1 Tax=Petrolisthes cinctipes TaxID=88211 RepID=A0AAE1GHA9_PETCI|nr:hypothetical protein Pcinc_003100 [Petrolisthes cinctipes]